MNSIEAMFRFSDVPLGRVLLESTPPDGVEISEDDSLVCADGSLGVDVSIHIGIHINTAIISLGAAVAWIVAQLKKRGHKQGRINARKVHLEQADILRLIQDEVRKQELRDAQWRAEHKKLE
jgi:hypothetical protein